MASAHYCTTEATASTLKQIYTLQPHCVPLDYIKYISVLLTYFIFIEIFCHHVLSLIIPFPQIGLPHVPGNCQCPPCVGNVHQLNTSLTALPIVVVVDPQMIYGYGQPRWNDIDGGNKGTRRTTCLSSNLFTTNLTWTDPGVNLGQCCEMLVANHLSHGIALLFPLIPAMLQQPIL
jgi:hypothetical protein